MFAIIDIETCGGSFDYKRGRITEICILIHDGLQVVDQYTTLINPECNITPYFTKLTGITNEMVMDAPKFYEIAKKIVELTEGKIFVAHNVAFDYGFIKDEFASLGAKYQRETLCTVRLSRKLIPNRISYSLGHLCAALGIEIFGRHRAEGDAVATAKLFDLLLKLKADHPQYKTKGVEALMTRRVDNIKSYILKKLPEECGVYYFLDANKNIIYIGKSKNAYQRAIAHFNTDSQKNKKMLFELMDVDFVEYGSELVALLVETDEIKKLKPKYNRARKKTEFTDAIVYFEDEQGAINFELKRTDECTDETPVLLKFTSYSSAREKLEGLIDEFGLCLSYCGLTSKFTPCFHHQIKKCHGICNEAESVLNYNFRAANILKAYLFPNPNFIILDKGRNFLEKSVIVVENNKVIGYKFMDVSDPVTQVEFIKSGLSRIDYYPDQSDMVRGWLNKNKVKVINYHI